MRAGKGGGRIVTYPAAVSKGVPLGPSLRSGMRAGKEGGEKVTCSEIRIYSAISYTAACPLPFSFPIYYGEGVCEADGWGFRRAVCSVKSNGTAIADCKATAHPRPRKSTKKGHVYATCPWLFYGFVQGFLKKRMPRQAGPQWQDTVQPALVCRISSKGARARISCSTLSAVSRETPVA